MRAHGVRERPRSRRISFIHHACTAIICRPRFNSLAARLRTRVNEGHSLRQHHQRERKPAHACARIGVCRCWGFHHDLLIERVGHGARGPRNICGVNHISVGVVSQPAHAHPLLADPRELRHQKGN
jgi:hypothetical protein